ncbi:MAG: pilin [Chloroflexota bacterium]|nr:pilin [Chloroflexota bacterium]
MDPGSIVNMFTQLITLGTTIGLIVCAFFVTMAGYQYMTAGGSVRAIESAKGSLYNAFIGLAIGEFLDPEGGSNKSPAQDPPHHAR